MPTDGQANRAGAPTSMPEQDPGFGDRKAIVTVVHVVRVNQPRIPGFPGGALSPTRQYADVGADRFTEGARADDPPDGNAPRKLPRRDAR